MFADEVISQAVTRHFEEPVESGICFGIPRHHLKRSGRVVFSVITCVNQARKKLRLFGHQCELTSEESCTIYD